MSNSGDGSIELGGRFDVIDVRTGVAPVRLDVVDGSVVKSDWASSTGDGSITVRLPQNHLGLDLDAHTGDGGVYADGIPGTLRRPTMTTVDR